MTEEKIKTLIEKLRKLVPARVGRTTLAACAEAADALEILLQTKPVSPNWRLHNRLANVPHHRDSDMRVIGFVVPVSEKWPMACIAEQLAEIIEPEGEGPVKNSFPQDFVKICQDEVTRGSLTSLPKKYQFMEDRGYTSLNDLHQWMSETRRKFIDAVANMESDKSECKSCADTGYVPDGNHCMECSEPANPDLEELFQRQQAGFEQCYEALGITDDRERSWSALVIAIHEAVQARRHDFEFDAWFDKNYPQNEEGRRPKYSATTVMDLMRDAFESGRNYSKAVVRMTDAQIKDAVDAIDFGTMVTADDYIYVIARAVLAAQNSDVVVNEKPVDLLEEKLNHTHQKLCEAVDSSFKEDRIKEIRARLSAIEGNRDYTIAREALRRELNILTREN